MNKVLSWLKQHMGESIILIVVTVTLCCFMGQKQGFHMDEMLSFQLSNARFNPWIVSTQPQGRLAKFYEEEILGENFGDTVGNLVDIVKDVLQNRGNSLLANYKADVYEEPVWIDRQQFQDYITVDRRDAFNYLSVYFNVKDDNHPPLHFMVLHTISSLFQGKAEAFMGCIINIAAVLGCCILMMKLGKLYGKKETGMLAALLYGLSSGAIATTLLIRMYAIMTFFCVAFFYQNMVKWKKGDFTKHNKWLIAVTVMGFWTQYFFLFYCIGLAAVMVILLWKEKKYKDMFGYIRSMVVAALIGVAIFPFAISDVFSSERGVEALDNLANGLEGYGERLAVFGQILLSRVFGNVWLGCVTVGLILLLVVLGACRVRRSRGVAQCNSTREWHAAEWCMLVIPPIGYVLLAARMSPYLVDRYIMAAFPFGSGILALGLIKAGKLAGEFTLIKKKTGLGSVIPFLLAACICAANIFTYDGEYLYKGYEEQEQVSVEYSDLACICIYDGVGYYENLKEFTHYKRTLLLKQQELENRVDTQSLVQDEQIVVLIKQNTDRQKALKALEQYGIYEKELLVQESVYGDYVVLCEVKR